MAQLRDSNPGPLLVGVDLGTTNVKAAVFDQAGQCVALGGVPTTTHFPRPLWAFYDPAEMWQSVCQAIRSAVDQIENPNRIAGVAVASIGETGVPIDINGNPTFDAIAWFDRRTIPQCEQLEAEVGEAAIFASTGLSLQPIYSLCKLLWIKSQQPKAWSRTVRWLMAADYIAYKLSGAQATDYSLASRTMAMNIQQRQWDEELLEAVGVSSDIFAPLVQSGERIGRVTPDAAASTGLPAGIAVGAGGHDHVVGALAAGVVQRDQMLDSMGTAEALFFPLEQPVTDPALSAQGYSQGAHVLPDKYYLFGGVYTSGGSVDWFREILGQAEHAEIIAAASKLPPGGLGTVFIPHLRLADAPHNDPKARAAFIGLTSDVTQAGLMRAVYEGVAFEARSTIEPALPLAQLDCVPAVSVIGGSTRNDLLINIKASVLNQTHQVLEVEETTALGAAILGGVAAEVYRSGETALEQIETPSHVVKPDPATVAIYDELYKNVFERLYTALKPINHHLYNQFVSGRESSDISEQ